MTDWDAQFASQETANFEDREWIWMSSLGDEGLDLIWLVVWNMNFMTFRILGIIIPTDQYFSEGLKPPTSNCMN